MIYLRTTIDVPGFPAGMYGFSSVAAIPAVIYGARSNLSFTQSEDLRITRIKCRDKIPEEKELLFLILQSKVVA